MSSGDVRVNGTHYDCWICGCKPGEPHGPALETAAVAAREYPDDNDPED